MQNQAKGFTLIELMIVVAIIAILASLAMSAYQTYTVRSQVAEAMVFAAGAKTPVVDAFNNTGVPPADRVAAGMTAQSSDSSGSYVSGIDIVNGRIEVTLGNRVHQDAFGMSFSLTPYQSAGNTFVWRCGYAPAPAGTSEISGGGVTTAHEVATIDERYLPSTCRQ